MQNGRKKIRELYAQTDIKDVFDNLHSSADGLTSEEADRRLNKYGENTIKKAAAESEWKTFFKLYQYNGNFALVFRADCHHFRYS